MKTRLVFVNFHQFLGLQLGLEKSKWKAWINMKKQIKDIRKAAGDLPFTIVEGGPIIYKKYRLLRKKLWS